MIVHIFDAIFTAVPLSYLDAHINPHYFRINHLRDLISSIKSRVYDRYDRVHQGNNEIDDNEVEHLYCQLFEKTIKLSIQVLK